MGRFNLVDESWIPVRFADGARQELGIKDTLLRSGEIDAIEHSSPLVVAALHRFLLAVLYRALEGPTGLDQAMDLFRGGLPGEKIACYLQKWRDRFWLFDDRYPFGQIPGFTPKVWRAWSVLAAEHNADHAKVLFDHVDVQAPGTISEASAARWLISSLTFSVSCGRSELSHTGTAPSATAVMVIPLGCNLQDTLILSLVPQDPDVAPVDRALWERSPESVASLKAGLRRAPVGLADRYTWRSRSIRLEDHSSGRVERVAFASGVDLASTDQTDPMNCYRIDEARGKVPVQFQARGFWRGYDSLIPDASKLAPQVVEHAVQLTRPDRSRFPRSVLVLGQATDQSKIEFWRMERFPLPAALASDLSISSDIRQLLADAEDANRALWTSSLLFAHGMLSRKGGKRKPGGRDVSNFIKKMPGMAWYWSSLESRFHGILREYDLGRDTGMMRCHWLISVRCALRVAWEQYNAPLSAGNAWTARARLKAEGHVARRLKQLDDEIALLAFSKEELAHDWIYQMAGTIE